MTKKLLHVVVFLATTFALHSQAPGYFGKTFYASAGIETDLVKLEQGSIMGYNLEVGKLLTKSMGVAVSASYANYAISENHTMRNESNQSMGYVAVDFAIPSTTFAVVLQSYGRRGAPAPIGIYSKLGISHTMYSVNVKEYMTEYDEVNGYGEANAKNFDLPEKASLTAYRIGVGYNILLNQNSFIGLESIMDLELTISDGLSQLPIYSEGNYLLKVSYVHFLF